MKYCNNCRQMVSPKKDFNGCLFVFLLFTFIGWIIYLIVYGSQEGHCPFCKSRNWGVPQPSQPQVIQQVIQPQIIQSPAPQSTMYCSLCGSLNDKKNNYCGNCAALLKQ